MIFKKRQYNSLPLSFNNEITVNCHPVVHKVWGVSLVGKQNKKKERINNVIFTVFYG